MLTIRRSAERGHADHGWLDARHTFSFAGYHDPDHMGFRSLRVINEDRVQAGQGFGMHGHRDMEIVTVVLEGALEHRDSLGNGSVIRPGDVQRMSAGTGVRHSEVNGSKTDPVHLLQIWIEPEARGLAPEYEQKRFDPSEHADRLRLLVAPDGRSGSLSIHQDAEIHRATLGEGASVRHDLGEDRFAWVQVISGEVDVNGRRLVAGDAARVAAEDAVTVRAATPSDILLFDLA